MTTNFMIFLDDLLFGRSTNVTRIDLPKVVLIINEANWLQGGTTELQYAFLQLLTDEVVPVGVKT